MKRNGGEACTFNNKCTHFAIPGTAKIKFTVVTRLRPTIEAAASLIYVLTIARCVYNFSDYALIIRRLI